MWETKRLQETKSNGKQTSGYQWGEGRGRGTIGIGE